MWHIKNTNGLFYYSLDYIDSIENIDSIILRRDFPETQTLNQVSQKYKVVRLNTSEYIRYIIQCFMCGKFIFTPSSHPLPIIKKQLIIVHDMYPFTGMKGWLKKILFKVSVNTSRCKVGYINSSEVRKDLLRIPIIDNQLIFCPNKFPHAVIPSISPLLVCGDNLKIGLVGTDSEKKNYHKLFSRVRDKNLSDKIHFIVYGHETIYFKQLRDNFKDLNISLVKSDDVKIESFFTQVNALVSVCTMEGFGRPIATALVNKLPTHLIRCNVFEEFFSGGAYFYKDIDELLSGIFNEQHSDLCEYYHPPIAVLDAYKSAIEYIQNGK